MTSPQNTATASESLHVPVGAAAATTEPAPTRALRVRVVGAAAIASAASVVIDNTGVGWAGSPTYAAPIKEVLAFHAENRAAVEIAVGLEALTLPLLLLFVTGLHGLVGRRGGAGADWSRLAVAAGATFSAVTAFYAVLWDGVVLSAGQLTEVISTGRLMRLLGELAALGDLRDAARPVGLVTFTPHDFRRLFTTEFVGSGLPLHIAATVLAHLSLETTRGWSSTPLPPLESRR